MDSKPLVSIIVLTYNSEQYVLETLESAKNQTYEEVELIISDDSSKDQTVNVCQKWIDRNPGRFRRMKIITVSENTGTPSNCNRGVLAAKGEWVKIIAGDDTLKMNCIQANLMYLAKNRDAKVIQSNMALFKGKIVDEKLLRETDILSESNFFLKEASIQYRMLLRRNYLRAPAVFMFRQTILETGGFDEAFRLIEDLPFWLNVTRHGVQISFLNEITVNYRLHDSSVQRQAKPYWTNSFLRDYYNVQEKYVFPEVGVLAKWRLILKIRLMFLLNNVGLNNSSFHSKALFFLASKVY